METPVCYSCFREKPFAAGSCPHCGYDSATAIQNFPLALREGSILNGRYIIGRPLGQGGFGITYLAQDVQTGQRVAIKEFFPETLATRAQGHTVTAYSGLRQENFQYGIQCFLEEARTLAKFIGEKNIIQVYCYFEENGTAYFVMEYVDGISLQSYLTQKGGSLPWEEALSILLPAMDALSIVHSQGIIHRDVSADNIYLTWDGQVKLLDFGAARYSMGDRSRSLDVVLKAGYAPKEQYTRRGRQGAFTDVYAMAATVYRAITGKLPPESIEREEEDLLILPSSMGIKLPLETELALEKGLAVRSMDRYQLMSEFRQALSAGLRQQPVTPPRVEILPEQPPAEPRTEDLRAVPIFPSDPKKPEPIPENPKKPEDPPKPEVRPRLDRNWIAAGIFAAVLVTVLIACFWLIPRMRYDQACEDLANQDFDAAHTAFVELGDYADSQFLASEALYRKANSLMASQDYDEAYQLYTRIEKYADSAALAQSARYQHAHALLADNQFEEAQEIFSELKNYEDSRNMVKECQYQQALYLQEKDDFVEAYRILRELKDYKDSVQQLSLCAYGWADFIFAKESSHQADYFVKTVALQTKDYDTIYGKICDYIHDHPNYSDWITSRRTLVSTMLQSLSAGHEKTADLRNLFEALSDEDFKSKDYIRENHSVLEVLWEFGFVQDFLTNDTNIYCFMESDWITLDNAYQMHFYKNDSGGTTFNSTLPTTQKSSAVKYYTIEDLLMYWTDDDDNNLGNVYDFHIYDFNTISVYSYQNQQYYNLVRQVS